MHNLLCPFADRRGSPSRVERMATNHKGQGETDKEDETAEESWDEDAAAGKECTSLRTCMLIVRCNNTGCQAAVELCLNEFHNVGHFLAHLAKATGNRPTAIEEAVITLPCDLNRFIPTGGAYLKIAKGDQNAFLSFVMVTESTDLAIFYCSVFFKPVWI
jgi:hypothetical protein